MLVDSVGAGSCFGDKEANIGSQSTDHGIVAAEFPIRLDFG